MKQPKFCAVCNATLPRFNMQELSSRLTRLSASLDGASFCCDKVECDRVLGEKYFMKYDEAQHACTLACRGVLVYYLYVGAGDRDTVCEDDFN